MTYDYHPTGSIEAFTLPHGLRVIFSAFGVMYWIEILPFVSAVIREMTRLGIAELAPFEVTPSELSAAHATPAEAGTPKRRGSGRQRDADYEWASHEVYVRGRDRAEVFKEWAERIGKDRYQALSNPLDSFNKGIKPKK